MSDHRDLPLLGVLIDDVRVREVQVDGGGAEPVMAENLLDGGQRNTLLNRQRGEGVPQHMRRHVLGDAGAFSNALDDLLHLAWANELCFMQTEVGFQQCLHPA